MIYPPAIYGIAMAKLPVKMDDFIDDIIPMNRSDYPVRKL
jgi:hypothetical protein